MVLAVQSVLVSVSRDTKMALARLHVVTCVSALHAVVSARSPPVTSPVRALLVSHPPSTSLALLPPTDHAPRPLHRSSADMELGHIL